jgi:16S rRNA (guanine(966)-N(2))-methyltransferase RsmD
MNHKPNRKSDAAKARRQNKPVRAKMGAGAKAAPDGPPAALRIIGGAHRGRKLEYSGDPRTRPMKDRVREAVFNLLGPDVAGKFVVDLFAGTGALGLEALSRGASRALFLEQHFPSAEVIRRNAATLGLAEAAEVLAADTFIRFRRGVKLGPEAEAMPWVVFCSPPFEFYVSRRDEMLELIGKLFGAAPAGSLFAVESDARFDFGALLEAAEWDVRDYPPARVGIFRKR